MNLTAVQVQMIDGLPTGGRQQAASSMGLLDSFAQIIAGMAASMQEQGESGAQGQIPVPEQKEQKGDGPLMAALQLLANGPGFYGQIPAKAELAHDEPAESPGLASALQALVPKPVVSAPAAEQAVTQSLWTAEAGGKIPQPVSPEAPMPSDAFGSRSTEEAFGEIPVLQAEYSREPREEGRQETETLFTAQRQLRSAVDAVKSRQQQQQDGGKAEELNVDQLQGQVDAQKSFGMVTAKKAEATVEAPKLLEQLSTGIAEKLQKGESEFTLRLKPQELGEITVKLIDKAGKTTLSIVTASTQTAKLINADLSSLREVLRPMQVEVQDAVQQTGEAPQGFLNFDMSGGQRFGDGRQAFNEKQPIYYGRPEEAQEAAPEEESRQDGHYIMI